MHEYKWYLLNIAISIFNFDVTVGVLLRPISLFPLYGAFDIGLLNWFILTFNYGDNRDVIEALYRPALALMLGILNNTTLSLVNGFLYRWIALRPSLWLHNEKRYMYMAFFLVAYVGIAVWALLGIFSALKSNIESFSAQTIKLHRQLTLALMVQASVPFAMFIFPMGAALVMLFTGLQNVPVFYTFLLITVCSHSNFNVVLMLSLTSCYRETLRDAFYHLAEKVTGGKFKITKVKEISVQPSGSEY
ncbi:unnamed protein product, partial [Mesorhabditis belari]|uniref:G protein-coupled receptor n=1 Tax=Mesorhabditis belari TaxID=2138241 RepID=A0AAF3F6Z2_9BILA